MLRSRFTEPGRAAVFAAHNAYLSPGAGCNPLRTVFTARGPGSAIIAASRTSCGEALRCGRRNGSFWVTVIVARQLATLRSAGPGSASMSHFR
jgi:hypothetical protein